MATKLKTASPECYREAFLENICPPPLLTVSEWADEYRILPRAASAEPGRWRTSRAPYLKGIMDALSVNNTIQHVAFMKSSQVGGTEAGNNFVGYVIDHAPGPIMAVLPTLDLAKRNSKQRFKPLIEETPSIKIRMGGDKSDDKALEKSFEGGILVITGANSASGLKSMPARFIFFDEVDEFPPDVDGQGDAVELGKARSRTFSKRKWFECSTPTVEGRSLIAKSFEESNQQYYYVPCPHCSHSQKLIFKRLKWEKGKPHTVHYECEKCDDKIYNWHKTKMLEAGDWVEENPDFPDKKKVGFHINSLYSPVGWYSWEEIAQDWENAQGNNEKLKAFINTALGETWKESSEKPDWNKIFGRRRQFARNVLVDDICLITCGVDVQKDRFELEIVGWSPGKVSYSIDYRVIYCDTAQAESYKKLDEILTETFPFESNHKIQMPIGMLAIDSGYNTQIVYNWVREKAASRVIAIRGFDDQPTIFGIAKKVDVGRSGKKKLRRGVQFWPIGTNLIKSELYGWLRQDLPVGEERIPVGFCFFPEYGPEYFKQLTSERLVKKIVNGKTKYIWEKDQERNEALDCRVYARAAAGVLGMDRLKPDDWEKLKNDLKSIKVEKETSDNKPKRKIDATKPGPEKRKIKRSRGSSFWD